MGHIPSEAAIAAHYGGSDNTSPSFNRPRYVRFASSSTAADLGSFEEDDLSIGGFIGAESGTQTLFFRFTLTEEARLGIDFGTGNPYLDQYVALALKAPTGRWIPLEDVRLVQAPAAVVTTAAGSVTPGDPNAPSADSYADPDYWFFGYTELDGGIPVPPPLPPGQVDPLAGKRIPRSTLFPAGEYLVSVTSSQWPQLPFRFQLVTRGNPHLHAAATVDLDPTARLSLVKIGGSADIQISPRSRIRSLLSIAGGADVAVEPRLTLRRVSPYS